MVSIDHSQPWLLLTKTLERLRENGREGSSCGAVDRGAMLATKAYAYSRSVCKVTETIAKHVLSNGPCPDTPESRSKGAGCVR